MPSTPKANPLIESANEELAVLLTSGKVSQREVSSLQTVIRDNVALRDKVTKLKSLLGRSAKTQKEAKVELNAARSKLEESRREVERLHRRVEHLESRPTHMDLLADFETNFDRAVLSVGTTGQSGGEDPSGRNAASATPAAAAGAANGAAAKPEEEEGEVVSAMLLTELSESKARIERMESLNSALLHRSSKLEKTNGILQDERDEALSKMNNLRLELRMAKMETDAASRSAKERAASLAEMQLEIDLVTRASMDANARAAEGLEAAKTVKSDRKHVEELEMQVDALREWALASAEAKRLTVERARELERKLRSEGLGPDEEGLATKQSKGVLSGSSDDASERLLWTKASSIVIGAGDVGIYVVELGTDCDIANNETVLLRWKFDVTPAEMDIEFSVLKGRCEDRSKQRKADTLIKDRLVHGGGGGEIGGAFAVQNACTLLWSNVKSWVRPRSIKFTVEAYAVMD